MVAWTNHIARILDIRVDRTGDLHGLGPFVDDKIDWHNESPSSTVNGVLPREPDGSFWRRSRQCLRVSIRLSGRKEGMQIGHTETELLQCRPVFPACLQRSRWLQRFLRLGRLSRDPR